MEHEKWHALKIKISAQKHIVDFHPKEVWFSYVGYNIGTEQNGKGEEFLRPVLIIKKFNTLSALVVPLTSTIKAGKYYYVVKVNDVYSSVILSQIKFIDIRRLKYKIGQIEHEDFIKNNKKNKKENILTKTKTALFRGRFLLGF